MSAGECIIEFRNVELRPNSQTQARRFRFRPDSREAPATKLHRGEALLLRKAEVPFLMEMAAGLEPAKEGSFFAAGEILFRERNWAEIEDRAEQRSLRGKIGFVLSHERKTGVWISHGTFRENILLGSSAAGKSEQDSQKRLEELAKMFGVDQEVEAIPGRKRPLLDLRPSEVHDEHILTALQWVRARMNPEPDLLIFEDALEPFLARDDHGQVLDPPRLRDKAKPNLEAIRENLKFSSETPPAVICRTKCLELWREILEESRYTIFRSTH